MKIAFNPSTVAALTSPPNNKDITFDLKGHNIFARGVKFYGTDTNTWRPVVDNLTSDSTTSSLSAKQGKVLKALIDGKSNSGHTHDDRYLKLTGGTLTGNLTGTSATFSGRFHNSGDDEGIIIKPASNGYAGLTLGTHDGERSVFYFTKGNPFWRYNNGTNNLDIKHPKKAGTIALTSDIPTKGSWNYDDRYLRLSGGTMTSDALITFADSGSWGTDKGPQSARGGLKWSGQSDYVKLYAEETAGDNLDLVIQFGDDNSNGLSIRNKSNIQTSYISANGVITTSTFKGNLDWSYITNKPSSYTPSAHTHAWNSLTHSSTTANQAILTNGSANGWKLYTLNISAWDNAANKAHSHANKAVLDGITSTHISNWNTAYTFVHTITGTDTDKVINKWDEIVNFLAGIDSSNKLNTLLNSKLSVYELADKTNVGTIKNNGIYYSTTDASSGTLTNSPFNNGFALINMTSYDGGDDLRRSRLAFNAYGEIKVSDDRGQSNTAETWYNVLTSKNSGISGSTIKLNGTSITVYSSGTADGRYVKKSGDTMSGALNFANGTWNLVGDDSYMGDCNVSGHFGIRAANTTYPGVAFFNKANAHLGSLTAYSGNIKYGAYSLQFLDNGNTRVSAGTWTNPFSAYDKDAVKDGQAICVWGQSSGLSNLTSDSGDMSLWLKRINAKAATLNMVLDGEYYANGTQRLAHVSEIPTALKNPYALTISLNGTSQGPYDGSAAKSINITPGSIGAATSGHNHDGRYVYNYGGTQMDGSSRNKNALGMSTTSGISGDWWHILQAAWNDEYRWNSQIAFPTQNRNGMYYRSGLNDNTKWGAWVKLLDTGNSYVTNGKGVINGTTITQVDNSDKLDGFHANTGQSPFGRVPTIGNDGVMEIGTYIDFHYDNGGKYDYSTRLQATGNHQNALLLPSGTGTLALTSQIPTSLKNPNAIKFKDINGNIVTYDGSVAKDLTAGTYMAKLPYGFSSFASGVSWGNTTGTSFASWNDSTGGSIDFRRDNPSSGKMSIKVDGRVYVNEGRNPVLSAESNGVFWGMRTPDGGNEWIRTPDNGLIPYVSGGAGSGHSSLGTSGWYFSTAYIDKVYGSLKGNADTASSANKLTTARNIALGTDLRGSANFDGSGNITINANINACSVSIGSTNGLPFKRIAHFETGSSWNDNALLLYISQGYINGSNGICRVEFRTDNISTSNSNPSASALVRWLVRNGYGLDSLYAGYYVTAGKAYIDIYLKTTGGYQGTVIRVLQDSRGGINSNVQLINSHYHSDTDHKEAYSSIEAASTSLYNRAYTKIVSGSDAGTVNYANSTGSASSATKLQTARKLWGQSFDGTKDISGSLSGTGSITPGSAAAFDIGSNSLDYRYGYFHWIGAKKGQKLELGANDSGFGLGLCIDTNLNVGIGTNSPSNKLDVRGDTKITGSIRDLSIGGGIYWNPYVESATDGSDAASITVVRSGVAGGTTLVLSQMNDANDTIQFKTSDAARLYHNSNLILTSKDTKVSSGKGYINNTEITQVNNASSASKLNKWFGSRVADLNQQFGDGALRIFNATSSTTANKCPSDASILHLAWDNTGGYDTQLALATGGVAMYFRGQNGGTWQPWKTLAFTTDIPSSLKNPYSFNVFGVTYDGSAARTVTTSTFISQVNEATATVTDGTMLITSWASNSGFADTNAVNVPYKRKALHLWEYVKAKTDSLYAIKDHNHDNKYLRWLGNANQSNMNAIGRISHSSGMTALSDPGNTTDNPMEGGAKSGSWHLYWQTNYADDPSGSNAWVAQIVNRAGTDRWWVRSRNGGKITNGTGWASNWRFLVTAPTSGLGNSNQPVYINSAGEVVAANSYPTSLRNPHSLTLKANGTTLAIYDGSSAKEANFTYANVGAASASHTHTWASITDKLVAVSEFNIVNAGFNKGVWFNYLPINDRNKTATVQGYHFGNGARGYTNIKAAGFIKNGSNSSYVLLGDGGHKTISSLSVNYANSAGSATKVIVNQHTGNDINYPLVWSNQPNTSNVTENQLFKSWADLYYNPKNKRLTVGGSVVSSSFVKSGGTNQQLLRADGGVAAFNWSGQSGQPTWLWGGNDFNSYYVYNPSNFRVAYAASAGNADTLDGEHASNFVRAGAIEAGDGDLNALDTYSFIKSVNSKVASHSPKSATGWYNIIQAVHRNGQADGASYIGQIALGMTTNTDDMFFRGKRTDSWKTVIHSGNIGSQTVASASKLVTARKIWGQSFNGTADVNGTIYINNGDSENGAIILNNNVNTHARISAIKDNVVFNTGGAIRFGDLDWDYSKWAGLKYNYLTKTIYLGIADGSIFTTYGNVQNEGTLNLRANISHIDLNSGTSIRGLGTDGSPYYSSITLKNTSMSLSAYGDMTMSTGPGTMQLSAGNAFRVTANDIRLTCGEGSMTCSQTGSNRYTWMFNKALNVGGTLSINGSVIDCSASNISIKSKESGSLMIGTQEIVKYDSHAITFREKTRFLDVLCLSTIPFGSSSPNVATTISTAVCIDVMNYDSQFIFKPATDGQLLFLKVVKRYSSNHIKCTAEDCEVVGAAGFDIYLNRGDTKDIFADGKSRIFIYVSRDKRWYEFYCG